MEIALDSLSSVRGSAQSNRSVTQTQMKPKPALLFVPVSFLQRTLGSIAKSRHGSANDLLEVPSIRHAGQPQRSVLAAEEKSRS